jgi:DNA-binding transcriptional LysR family regulator
MVGASPRVSMPHLDNILAFVKVAEFESVSKAARSLGVPISTVSRRLSVLESELGVALVRRTTRRITLTPQGMEYHKRSLEPLAALQEAERALRQTQKRLEGTLKISVPMILGQASFIDFLSRFSRAHAAVRIDLYITNLYLNLVADNIDVAIRFGEQRDSSVVASKIGNSIRYVVATPDYLRGRKLPSQPEELTAHDCVMFNASNNETEWDLVSERRKVRVHVSGPISSRDCQTVSAFVLRGHGIGLIESTYCEQPLVRGELVRLLPRWTSPRIPVFAVYPTRKYLPSRVSAFLDALGQWNSPLWLRD